MKTSAVSYALFLLKNRLRSSSEIREKLRQKNYPPAEIDETITTLEARQILDDERFARSYASDKLTFFRRGRYRIGLELLKKGVDRELIDKAISDLSEEEESRVAADLIQARLRQWRDLEPLARYRRALSLLQRRGFAPRIIRQTLESLKK